jgi:saccharopine dehydrogenase-like NADP-dependent oxidoreductase
MRTLLVGVGSAFCAIAARRDFFEEIVVSDYDESRARHTADAVDDPRFSAAQLDATSADAVAELVRRHDITHVMNAVDPRFVMPIFNGALAGGADYLDMAMSLSQRHPATPPARPVSSSASRTSGGRSGTSRSSGSGWSRAFPAFSPATPPITCSPTSTSWARATGQI